MEDGSRRRSGFGGQSLIVELRSNRELARRSAVADSHRAGGPPLNEILNRALRVASFPLLNGLDEYGFTIFNQIQLDEVLPELERLRPFARLQPKRELSTWSSISLTAVEVPGLITSWSSSATRNVL